ncbi:hypothetical protein AXG93_4401s1000 [Marchantia polymorpha subsp. ruderalis]|uniref:Leucine-rich repeat-containing N-terminal plant-type domain-containing protein n=1 Tax=Marchantia polymorpha subsp. ruderalis TaxID=1480154 RepID=A0A176W4E3_MARPO|nr:hypothetical protein AXG93_4401s1000 [Marchantia polymorpha subsp. ruderalis]
MLYNGTVLRPWFIWGFWLVSVVCVQAYPSLEAEALFSLKGTYFSGLESWTLSTVPCDGWVGVKCDHVTKRIIEVNVTGLGVRGTVSSELCLLEDLGVLCLSHNLFDGELPSCLWNMTRLQKLEAANLNLNGSLSGICNLEKLEVLDLSFNDVRGDVPACLWNMAQLRSLDLSNNLNLGVEGLPASASVTLLQNLALSNLQLSGSLPAWLGSLHQLEELDLSFNNIADLPSSVGNLSSLRTLNLKHNKLTQIPPSIDGLLSIVKMDFSENFLTSVPSSLSKAVRLESLNLNSNYLSAIPTSLGNLQSLRKLLFAYNLCTDLPSSLGALGSLDELDASDNKLVGSFPTFIQNMTSLQTLNLAGNYLSGDIPTFVYSGSGFRLQSLNVSRNSFKGSVPDFSWGNYYAILDLAHNLFTGVLPPLNNCTFSLLRLSSNSLTGGIPLSWRNSTGLQMLDVSNNRLTGPVPGFFGFMKLLEVFDLSNNEFSGTLPSSLGNCTKLQRMRLGDNLLMTGPIPATMCSPGGSLLTLSLAYSNFVGEIPSSLGNCTGLKVLDLSGNQFSGKLPLSLQDLSSTLRVLIVAGNRLEGLFPEWIVNLRSLQVLDLSKNSFVGELPRDYSQLEGFRGSARMASKDTLYFDDLIINIKGGPLDLQYLLSAQTSFDVSSNLLFGNIPEELAKLYGLLHLTLFENNFTGTIPASLGPQMSSYNASSFAYNDGLCGSPLPRCVNTDDALLQSSSNKWISFPGVLAGAVIGFFSMSAIIILNRSLRVFFLQAPYGKAYIRHYTSGRPYGMYRPPK